jgi:hypothetical protein
LTHRFYVERNVGPDETRSRRLSFGREQLEEVATAIDTTTQTLSASNVDVVARNAATDR